MHEAVLADPATHSVVVHTPPVRLSSGVGGGGSHLEQHLQPEQLLLE